MKKILFIAFSLLLSVSLISCSDDSDNETLTEETEDNNQEENEDGETEVSNEEILIVYYSRTGENYPNNTVLTVGRTAVMAGYIQDYTGGAVFEIIPTISYPDDYDEMREVSQQETAGNARPAISNTLENLDQYKTIFIGSPIWYGAPPMIMRTFYETYDLSDKTIVIFGTHEGSGIGSCTTWAREYFPNATYLDSYGVRGQNINGARNDVESWLRRISIPEKE
jgi:flavodoxin